MSNTVKRLEKTVKETTALLELNEKLELETTLAGSIVTTIGILSGKTRKEIYEDFKDLKETLSTKKCDMSIEDLVEYVYGTYGKCNRVMLADLVLVTDDNGIYTPLVTFIRDQVLMPLSPDGIPLGAIGLAREGRDNISVEYIFDEDGLKITEEE